MSHENHDAPPDRSRLTLPEAEAVAAVLADVSAAGRPLADGLKAAARETAHRKVAAELRWLAAQVESGRSLEQVLSIASQPSRFPGYVAGLVQAALRTGRLGDVLIDMVDHQRTTRDMWRTVRASLAYSVLLLIMAGGLGLGVEWGLMGTMAKLYRDFEIRVPPITELLIWGHDYGVAGLMTGIGVGLGALLVFRLVGGAALWRRLLSSVPLIGALWHWSGVAELARLLSILTERGVPLPEALRLAASGVHAADMREVSRRLAAGVEQGRLLSDLIVSSGRLPLALGPIVRWGEQSGQLHEAFRVACEMFEGRVQVRAALVRSILPPIVFVLVGTFAAILITGFYWPMYGGIQWLM
jgi:type II secretory pathway component PulF